ncbi:MULTISPECIES: hypothetical protein [Roseobacteraceae]|uniref:hypothetical protein n=1 Tax=Sulfitobacter sp. DFL-23 TaxID=215829 RepID=UPI001F084B40|nr:MULTISPECIES: hypothetical protein [Roseobacteraceae]
MTREHEVRQGIGDASLRRGALNDHLNSLALARLASNAGRCLSEPETAIDFGGTGINMPNVSIQFFDLIAGQGRFDFAPHQINKNTDAFRSGQGIDRRDQIGKRAGKYADAIANVQVNRGRKQIAFVTTLFETRNKCARQRLRAARIAQDKPCDTARAIDRTPARHRRVKIDKNIAREERLTRLSLNTGSFCDSKHLRIEDLNPLSLQMSPRPLETLGAQLGHKPETIGNLDHICSILKPGWNLVVLSREFTADTKETGFSAPA